MIERAGRLVVLLLVAGPSVAVLAGRAADPRMASVLRAAMPEAGGWQPSNLRVRTGDTVRLRLTSDDVVHGFAIGRDARAPVEVLPGRMTEVALTFDHPGTYTFYCTRWCGPNHWRMRGTIEVTGSGDPAVPSEPAPYLALRLDIDAPHPVEVRPVARPVASRGAALATRAPEAFLAAEYIRGRSPASVWRTWRDATPPPVSDQQLWDGVAWLWWRQTTARDLAAGEQLFARDCAACHGPGGRGDGVMRAPSRAAGPVAVADTATHALGQHAAMMPPAAFTASDLLGASPALLHGKIVRGGMGTGMPAWGTIHTDAEVWALVSFLYGFQFSYREVGGQP